MFKLRFGVRRLVAAFKTPCPCACPCPRPKKNERLGIKNEKIGHGHAHGHGKVGDKSPKFKARHMLLLEVVVAIAILTLCILPILSPHLFILKAEQQFKNSLNLDHAVNVLYVDILEQLHKNSIPWSVIESGKATPIDPSVLEKVAEKGLKGSYSFKVIRKKYNNEGNWGGYLVTVVFRFGKDEEDKKAITIPYDVYILRNSPGQAPNKEDKDQAPEADDEEDEE